MIENPKMLWVAILAPIVVIAIITFSSSNEKTRTDRAIASSDHGELEAILWKLRRNWQSEPRAKIFREAADRFEELRSPLLELLAGAPHELAVEAIVLASALEITEAHQAIAGLAETGPERVRGAAIVAGERFKPWSIDRLVDFLHSGAQPVVLAALELSSSRLDRPLEEIVRLLGHEDSQVRTAAMNAIPLVMTSEELAKFVAAAVQASKDEAAHIIRAMGKMQSVPVLENFLLEQIQDSDPWIRMAALDALTNKGSPLLEPGAIWSVVVDSLVNPRESAKAFICLETTKSFSVDGILAELPGLNPYLKYFAARCLISAGEPEGINVLINLLETSKDEFTGVATVDVDAVLLASRQLLAELAKIGLYAGQEAWRDWYGSLGTLRPRTLRPPPIDLDPNSG